MAAVEMKVLTPEERLQREDRGLRSYHRNTGGFKERERRRQLAAEKAQERQDVSMARGVGDASKAFRTSHCQVFGVPFAVESMQLFAEGANFQAYKNLVPKVFEKA